MVKKTIIVDSLHFEITEIDCRLSEKKNDRVATLSKLLLEVT